MASSRKSTGSKSGGGRNVSLSDEDRRYLSERLGQAKSRGAASGAVSEGGLLEALDRFGLGSERVEQLRDAISDLDVREQVDKAQEYLAEQIESARDYARDNPGKVIGGAAGVLVGASLLAYALNRASGSSTRSKKAAAGRKGGKASASSSSSSSSGGGSKKSSSKSSSSKKSSKKASKRR